MWNVVNTLKPELVKSVVAAGMERRRMRNLQDQQKRKILVVKPDILMQLDKVNLLRSKFINFLSKLEFFFNKASKLYSQYYSSR